MEFENLSTEKQNELCVSVKDKLVAVYKNVKSTPGTSVPGRVDLVNMRKKLDKGLLDSPLTELVAEIWNQVDQQADSNQTDEQLLIQLESNLVANEIYKAISGYQGRGKKEKRSLDRVKKLAVAPETVKRSIIAIIKEYKSSAEAEAKAKAAEEKAKAAEEARLAAEAKAVEEAGVAAEEKAKAAAVAKADVEAKAAEEARLAAEAKAVEEARVAAEEKTRREEEAKAKAAEEKAKAEAVEEAKAAAEAADVGTGTKDNLDEMFATTSFSPQSRNPDLNSAKDPEANTAKKSDEEIAMLVAKSFWEKPGKKIITPDITEVSKQRGKAAEQALADAKQELPDAKQELADAKQELDDARQELDAAKQDHVVVLLVPQEAQMTLSSTKTSAITSIIIGALFVSTAIALTVLTAGFSLLLPLVGYVLAGVCATIGLTFGIFGFKRIKENKKLKTRGSVININKSLDDGKHSVGPEQEIAQLQKNKLAAEQTYYRAREDYLEFLNDSRTSNKLTREANKKLSFKPAAKVSSVEALPPQDDNTHTVALAAGAAASTSSSAPVPAPASAPAPQIVTSAVGAVDSNPLLGLVPSIFPAVSVVDADVSVIASLEPVANPNTEPAPVPAVILTPEELESFKSFIAWRDTMTSVNDRIGYYALWRDMWKKMLASDIDVLYKIIENNKSDTVIKVFWNMVTSAKGSSNKNKFSSVIMGMLDQKASQEDRGNLTTVLQHLKTATIVRKTTHSVLVTGSKEQKVVKFWLSIIKSSDKLTSDSDYAVDPIASVPVDMKFMELLLCNPNLGDEELKRLGDEELKRLYKQSNFSSGFSLDGNTCDIVTLLRSRDDFLDVNKASTMAGILDAFHNRYRPTDDLEILCEIIDKFKNNNKQLKAFWKMAVGKFKTKSEHDVSNVDILAQVFVAAEAKDFQLENLISGLNDLSTKKPESYYEDYLINMVAFWRSKLTKSLSEDGNNIYVKNRLRIHLSRFGDIEARTGDKVFVSNIMSIITSSLMFLLELPDNPVVCLYRREILHLLEGNLEIYNVVGELEDDTVPIILSIVLMVYDNVFKSTPNINTDIDTEIINEKVDAMVGSKSSLFSLFWHQDNKATLLKKGSWFIINMKLFYQIKNIHTGVKEAGTFMQLLGLCLFVIDLPGILDVSEKFSSHYLLEKIGKNRFKYLDSSHEPDAPHAPHAQDDTGSSEENEYQKVCQVLNDLRDKFSKLCPAGQMMSDTKKTTMKDSLNTFYDGLLDSTLAIIEMVDNGLQQVEGDKKYKILSSDTNKKRAVNLAGDNMGKRLEVLNLGDNDIAEQLVRVAINHKSKGFVSEVAKNVLHKGKGDNTDAAAASP